METTFQVETKDDWEKIRIVGSITEDAEVPLGNLRTKISSKVIFNFRQVSLVNSCGVRAWINFLRDIEKDREIVFEECTPEIISQVNMIPNFRGKSQIRSAYAAYVCPECDHQQKVLFEEGRNLPSSPEEKVADVKCESCGHSPMEMEELEEEYFGWLGAS